MIDKDKSNQPNNNQTKDNQPINDTWASESQDELQDWIEEQGIQLRY